MTNLILALILFSVFIITLASIIAIRIVRLRKTSEQKEAQLKATLNALRQSEQNFITIFQNSSDEIFVCDYQGNILVANKQASTLLGYSNKELLQMNLLDLKPLNRGRLFLNQRHNIKKDSGLLFDSEYITKDGDIVPVEINARMLEYNGTEVILSISRNLAKRKEMERKLLSVVIQTEEKERERFSKDMHDGIGPLLSTVKLYVNELVSPEIQEDEKREYVTQINKMLDDAVGSIREISNNLMPRVIHEYGLVKALESFCNKINQTGKIKVDFAAKNIDEAVTKNVQLILFRVISELLTNTMKHAQANNVYVQLERHNENITLIFTDDGIGFDSKDVMENKGTGIGLKNIVSRIRSINGHCEITSKRGEGFKILIEI
jgi:PAS domain S-box-containing protein